jgi:hypothetical protein
MKKIFNILLVSLLVSPLFISCSEKQMEDVNKDVNNASNVLAANILPTVIDETSFGTTGTDIAWYSSVFMEYNAGTYGQLYTADQRTGFTNSLFNNSWNSIYNNLETLKLMMDKCSSTGSESTNYICLGISKLLTAYNYAVLTDMWGSIPCSQALQGTTYMQPVFDSQKDVYTYIFQQIDEAITAFSTQVQANVDPVVKKNDLIYAGSTAKWLKAAYALKARYLLRLSNVISQMPESVKNASIVDCINKSFTSASDAFVFDKYENTAIGANPWYQFYQDRDYLGVSSTVYNLLVSRNDPRLSIYVSQVDGDYNVAPSGNAIQKQGYYSISALYSPTAPTPLMSYHELLFIKAEVLAGTDVNASKMALHDAVAASFAYNSVAGAETYFNNEVSSRFDANPKKEIMVQKYLAGFDAESMEAYNDYRRLGGYSSNPYITLNNPNNVTKGFPCSFPYSSDEIYANSNVPSRKPFSDKVWWAGGSR